MTKTCSDTCWTLVQGAAAGDEDDRSAFAQTYLPVVRAYVAARWQGGPLQGSIDDAVQDTFFECFKDGGALARVDRDGGGRFRTFLYAVVRNVARRHEERRTREPERLATRSPEALESNGDARLSRVFDRAWLDVLLRRAVERQIADARKKGPEAERRIELMRLRFVGDLPVREIARRWNVDAAVVHREYRQARREFQRALRTEVAFHHMTGLRTEAEIEQECAALLSLIE